MSKAELCLQSGSQAGAWEPGNICRAGALACAFWGTAGGGCSTFFMAVKKF